jgi:hypothetical protein
VPRGTSDVTGTDVEEVPFMTTVCFKKGETYKSVNYRPISLTCICCKLMEHIISSNIMSHLENIKILYNLQHGFRKARSCETQLIDFKQELAKSNNCSKQTVKHNFHSLFTTVITFCQFLYEVYELCFTVCLLQLLFFASSKSNNCSKQTVKHNS